MRISVLDMGGEGSGRDMIGQEVISKRAGSAWILEKESYRKGGGNTFSECYYAGEGGKKKERTKRKRGRARREQVSCCFPPLSLRSFLF